MGSRTRIAALAIAVLSVAAAASAQGRNLKEENRRRDQQLNDPARYLAMIAAYRDGDTAGSVDLLADAEWDEPRLKMQLRHLDFTPAQPEEVWRIAPVMHIDVALKLSATLNDEDEVAAVHLWMAGELITLGIRERGDTIRDLAERLYLALERLMVDRMAPYSAERVLRSARQRLPDRAPVLYESGRLAELFATDYAMIGMVRIHTLRGAEVLLSRIRERRTGYLNDAAGWLRRAATLDPGHDLLQVHLGRVLALRRDDDEAAAILARAAASRDDATGYLAGVFAGGLRERQKRFDEAAAAYRGAIARFPLGHAAYVGLSEVLQRTGKGDESRAVLLSMLTESLGQTREPQWWYFFDPPGVTSERFDAVRREVRR
jgi:hypothetical protein